MIASDLGGAAGKPGAGAGIEASIWMPGGPDQTDSPVASFTISSSMFWTNRSLDGTQSSEVIGPVQTRLLNPPMLRREPRDHEDVALAALCHCDEGKPTRRGGQSLSSRTAEANAGERGGRRLRQGQGRRLGLKDRRPVQHELANNTLGGERVADLEIAQREHHRRKSPRLVVGDRRLDPDTRTECVKKCVVRRELGKPLRILRHAQDEQTASANVTESMRRSPPAAGSIPEPIAPAVDSRIIIR